MKYLLLVVFVAVVWWVWSKRQAGGRNEASTRQDRAAEKMVSCAHCGVHLPESEGLAEGDRVYCSEAHRAAGGTRAR